MKIELKVERLHLTFRTSSVDRNKSSMFHYVEQYNLPQGLYSTFLFIILGICEGLDRFHIQSLLDETISEVSTHLKYSEVEYI